MQADLKLQTSSQCCSSDRGVHGLIDSTIVVCKSIWRTTVAIPYELQSRGPVLFHVPKHEMLQDLVCSRVALEPWILHKRAPLVSRLAGRNLHQILCGLSGHSSDLAGQSC